MSNLIIVKQSTVDKMDAEIRRLRREVYELNKQNAELNEQITFEKLRSNSYKESLLSQTAYSKYAPYHSNEQRGVVSSIYDENDSPYPVRHNPEMEYVD